MLRLMGLADIGDKELYLLLLICICTSMAIGWAMDLIMRRVGFGIFGNTMISMAGIGCGLAIFHRFYRIFEFKTMPITIMIIVASIMFLLVILSWLRRVLKL